MVPQRIAVQCGNRCSRHQALVFVANALAGQGANVKQTTQKRTTNSIGQDFRKTLCMLTSRKDLSTAVHFLTTFPAVQFATTSSKDNTLTSSPSLRHESCPTQAEGWWSRTSSVRLGLCRMQATRWQATATEMLLPLCDTRSESKRNKKTRRNKQKIINGRRSKNRIDAAPDTTKRKFSGSKNPKTASHKAQIL